MPRSQRFQTQTSFYERLHTQSPHAQATLDSKEALYKSNAQKSKCRPMCYYHQNEEIHFFCTNQRCTLPLCDECLQIHRVEHLDRKQVPMRNIIALPQAKSRILKKMKATQSKTEEVQKNFQRKLSAYKEQIVAVIHSTVDNLRTQLILRDEKHGAEMLHCIESLSRPIEQNSSIKDLIIAYETFNCQEIKEWAEPSSNEANSFLENIKLAVDEAELKKVVKRGFLNCKFMDRRKILDEKPKEKLPTLSRQEYLEADQQQLDRKIESGVYVEKQQAEQKQNSEDGLLSDLMKKFETKVLQKQPEIKKQERKSIFDKNQGTPRRKSVKIFSKDPFIEKGQHQRNHSDVKKYQIQKYENSCQQGRSNIYTQKLDFDKKETNPKDTRHIFSNRVRRSASNGQIKRGLSLTKTARKTETDHYLKKQGQAQQRVGQKLSREDNQNEPGQASNSRSLSNASSRNNWQRVVNLQDSRESGAKTRAQDWHPNQQNPKYPQSYKGMFELDLNKNVEGDILDPMQMRQVLVKKKMEQRVNSHRLSLKTFESEYQANLKRARYQH